MLLKKGGGEQGKGSLTHNCAYRSRCIGTGKRNYESTTLSPAPPLPFLVTFSASQFAGCIGRKNRFRSRTRQARMLPNHGRILGVQKKAPRRPRSVRVPPLRGVPSHAGARQRIPQRQALHSKAEGAARHGPAIRHERER